MMVELGMVVVGASAGVAHSQNGIVEAGDTIGMRRVLQVEICCRDPVAVTKTPLPFR